MMDGAKSGGEHISPSMVRSVFGQLKSNGYSHGQIRALSRELGRLADQRAVPASGRAGWDGLNFEVDLSELAWLEQAG
jgi:hypothetical protein